MDKRDKLQSVQTSVSTIADFLSKHLHVINAHTCDFISNDLWSNLFDSTIADELLALSKEQILSLPGLFQTHSTNHCNVSPEFNRNEYEKSDSSQRLVVGKNLEKILCEAAKCDIKNVILASDQEIILKMMSDFPIHISHGMTEKKSHEIMIMTQICAALAKEYDLKQVIDIGSGKGYLGCQLAMTHHINVLGIDYSKINQKSSEIRTTRVQKYWPGLVRNTTSKMQKDYHKFTPTNDTSQRKLTEAVDCVNDLKVSDTSCSKNGDFHEASNSHPDAFGNISSSLTKSKTLYNQITEYISSDTNLLQLIKSYSTAQNHGEGNNVGASEDTLLLTGLHTCGNLASNLLKLFVNNEQVKAVCNVGCCYHLIEEEFVANCHKRTEESLDSGFGFPLSTTLKSMHYKLGRNARMLACQAPQRLVHNNKLPDQSLYWRALLQVILSDITGKTSNDWQVGKLARKTRDFKEYVRKALKKLEIDKTLTDEEITVYEDNYGHYERKLNIFFQFKAALASSVESLILQDRICYLLEQDSVKDVYAGELFDPLISPRCHVLVAIKK